MKIETDGNGDFVWNFDSVAQQGFDMDGNPVRSQLPSNLIKSTTDQNGNKFFYVDINEDGLKDQFEQSFFLGNEFNTNEYEICN